MALSKKEYREKLKSISFHGKMRGGKFGREFDRWNNSELTAYEGCVKEGIQPDGTGRTSTDNAKRISDKLGTAYRGDDLTGTVVRGGLIEQPTPLSKEEMKEARERSI